MSICPLKKGKKRTSRALVEFFFNYEQRYFIIYQTPYEEREELYKEQFKVKHNIWRLGKDSKINYQKIFSLINEMLNTTIK